MVVTVKVVEPLPVTEVGLKVHAEKDGRPVHLVKFTVPLYPVPPVTVRVRVPEPPGAAMVMVVPVDPVNDKAKSGATVTITADEVEEL